MNDASRTPAHLVLGAGGVRCLAYIGALEPLQSVYRFESVSACSAGTLVGALLCAGVTPAAMREEVLARDLREIGGAVRFRRVREVTRRRRWPYALLGEPTMGRVFEEIAERHGRERWRLLGDLSPALATAAVDVVSERLLVYSTGTHPDMPVTKALSIATAVPSMYRPHEPDAQMEVVDAAVTCYTPLWLATGAGDGLPIVVLRVAAAAQRPPRTRFSRWISEVVQSGVASQDNYALERSARVTVHDIRTDVDAFAFDLDRAGKEALIAAGRTTVATDLEVQDERRRQAGPAVAGRELRPRPTPRSGDDGEAALEGTWRQRRHANEGVPDGPDTLFISYARGDLRFVNRLRHHLDELVNNPHVTVWDDSYIGAGERWEDRIADAVLRARAAILLVSAEFNASKYIRSTELPLLRRKGATTVWVSLDGSLPFDAREQALQGFKRPDRAPGTDAEIEELLSDAAAVIKPVFARAF